MSTTFKPAKPKKEHKKKSKGYLSTLGAVAPAFAVKSLIEYPKGFGESALEQKMRSKILKTKGLPTSKVLKKALTGRGLYGLATSGPAGVLTAPTFIKGVELLGSEDKKDKAKGMALVLGSGTAFQAAKGVGKGFGEAGEKGIKGFNKRLKWGWKNRASTRLIGKLPTTAIFGLALASGRKKKKSGKPGGIVSQTAKPALYAGLGAAGLGVGEHVGDIIRNRPKGMSKTKALKHTFLHRHGRKAMIPGVAAKGLAGLTAGALSSVVLDKAVKAIKKKHDAK